MIAHNRVILRFLYAEDRHNDAPLCSSGNKKGREFSLSTSPGFRDMMIFKHQNRMQLVSASCLRMIAIAHKDFKGISKFFP